MQDIKRPRLCIYQEHVFEIKSQQQQINFRDVKHRRIYFQQK